MTLFQIAGNFRYILGAILRHSDSEFWHIATVGVQDRADVQSTFPSAELPLLNEVIL